MPIDYNALATQARGSNPVDYDALAEQARSGGDDMTAGGFLSNLVTSTGQQFANVGHAIAHPIDTVRGMADIAAGGFNSLDSAENRAADEKNDPAVARANRAWEGFSAQMKARYGSLEAFKHTLYTDPAGAAMDLSMVLGGAGEAADAAHLGTAARVLKTGAEFANPIAVPAMIAGKAISPLASVVNRIPAVRTATNALGEAANAFHAATGQAQTFTPAPTTTLLPEEVAAPLQARADALAEQAKTIGQQTAADATARTTTAAQGLQQRFSDALDNSKFGAIDDVTKAATAGDPKAGQVLQTLKAATTPDQIQRASIVLQDYRTSQQATALYDRVGDLVAEHDLPDVPLDRTREVLGGLQDFLRQDLNPAANKNVTRVLDGIRTKLDETHEVEGPQPETPPEAPNPAEAKPAAPAAAAPAAAPSTTPGSPETSIQIPGTDRSYPATWEIVERKTVQGSHKPNYEPNPQYGLINDRGYNDAGAQAKIEGARGKNFNPAEVANTSPSATTGAPAADEAGNLVSGNGRKIMVDNAYDADPGNGLGMKDHLVATAHQFGTTPEAVRGMQEPMLVRRIPDEAFERPGMSRRDAITDMNVSGTAAMTPAEQAIADARRVSQGTLDHVATALDAKGPDATVSQVLEGQGGVDVLNKLIADGVIPSQHSGALRTDTALTDAGKARIQSLMTGRFFRDASQIENTAPSVKAKIERIAAPAALTEREGAFNLTPQIKSAVDLLEAQRAHGSATLDDYLNQSSLFASERYSPEAIELARQLQTKTPTQLTEAVRKYAADAKYAGDYNGPGLTGEFPDKKTPRQAFNDAFKTTLKEQPAPAAEPPSSVPQKRADFDSTFKAVVSPKKVTVSAANTSYQNIRRLDSSLGQMIRDGHTGDGALIGNNGVQYLQQLREAIRGDMSDFAEHSGAQDVADAAHDADQFYQQARVPFKATDVAKAASGTTDSDRIFDGFVQAGRGEKAQRYYDALDTKGRAAVRSQMATDAVNQATDNLHGTVDPQKLLDHLVKMEEPYGVFFRGTDKFEIDGLRNFARQELLNAESTVAQTKTAAAQAADAAQAAQDKVKAAKGMERLPLGLAAHAGMAAGIGLHDLGMPVVGGVVASAGAVAALMKALTMTDAGRRFLLAGSTLVPGTRAMSNLVQRAAQLGRPAAQATAYTGVSPTAAASPSQ